MKKEIVWFSLLIFFNQNMLSQGTLSGNVRLNTDFYDRDVSIGTLGPNYDYNKSSANAWMQAIYNNRDLGFEAGIRFDGNYNSILQNPPTPVNFYGIGNWYLKKQIDDLEATAGYIYEQFGTGIAFRTFEERNLGIDNALFGVRFKYKFNDDLRLKVIAGTQKFQLGFQGSFVKGLNLEYSKDLNSNIGINAGVSAVSRTLTQEDRKAVDDEVTAATNDSALRKNYFKTPYNTHVFSIYNTLRVGNLSWFVEAAYKTKGEVFNPYTASYFNKSGYSIYNSLTYTRPKFGMTIQNRIVEYFQFQSTSKGAAYNFNLNNNRRLSFLAPINKQNSLRLPARFQIAPQEIGEVASSIDITYALQKHISVNFNASIIDTIGWKDPYYREAMLDVEFKKLLKGKLDLHVGAQYIYLNQIRYQVEGVKDMQAVTGFIEPTFRLSRKKSIRLELQVQNAPKDIGQSVFALLEYSVAPHWSFSVSDLYNFKPNTHYEIVPEYRTSHHFYSVFASYTKGTTRLTLSYAKQLAGIVCTGGVCRFEPAFSGLRLQLTSSF